MGQDVFDEPHQVIEDQAEKQRLEKKGLSAKKSVEASETKAPPDDEGGGSGAGPEQTVQGTIQQRQWPVLKGV